MIIADPDHLKIILSFSYRGYSVELDRKEENGQEIYSVWVSYSLGSTVAVPYASTSKAAIRKAKRWIDHRIDQ